MPTEQFDLATLSSIPLSRQARAVMAAAVEFAESVPSLWLTTDDVISGLHRCETPTAMLLRDHGFRADAFVRSANEISAQGHVDNPAERFTPTAALARVMDLATADARAACQPALGVLHIMARLLCPGPDSTIALKALIHCGVNVVGLTKAIAQKLGDGSVD